MTDRYTQWLIIGALNNAAVLQLAAVAATAVVLALVGPRLWPAPARGVLVTLLSISGVVVYALLFAVAIIQVVGLVAGGG